MLGKEDISREIVMASQRQPSDFGDTVVLEPNVSLLLKRARTMSDAVRSKEKELDETKENARKLATDNETLKYALQRAETALKASIPKQNEGILVESTNIQNSRKGKTVSSSRERVSLGQKQVPRIEDFEKEEKLNKKEAELVQKEAKLYGLERQLTADALVLEEAQDELAHEYESLAQTKEELKNFARDMEYENHKLDKRYSDVECKEAEIATRSLELELDQSHILAESSGKAAIEKSEMREAKLRSWEDKLNSEEESLEMCGRDLNEKEKDLEEREWAVEKNELKIRDFNRSVQVSQTKKEADLEKKGAELGIKGAELIQRAEDLTRREREFANSMNSIGANSPQWCPPSDPPMNSKGYMTTSDVQSVKVAAPDNDSTIFCCMWKPWKSKQKIQKSPPPKNRAISSKSMLDASWGTIPNY